MNNWYMWAAMAVILALGYFLRDIANPAKRGVAKYTKRDLKKFRRANSLMNPAELRLFQELSKKFNDDLLVVVKPRLGDLIEVRETVRDFKKRRALRNRVSSRHVDFAIIKENGTPLACVELDGKDHSKIAARRADKFKNELCAEVGLKMVRIKAKSNYASEVAKISVS